MALSGLDKQFLSYNVLDQPDPGEREHCDSDSERSDNEEEIQKEMQSMPDPIKQNFYGKNTGAKGVLADYKRHQAMKQMEFERAHMQSQRNMSIQARKFRDVEEEKEVDSSELDSDFDDDSDDDFMRQYREKRMQEMKSNMFGQNFGKIQFCSASEYVDEVNSADPSVFVVGHCYEDFLPASRVVNNELRVIAKKYPGVKFVAFQPSDLIRLDHIILPAFLINKGGNQVETIPRIQDEIGTEVITADDLEWLLNKHGVLA
eukprot:TRINITY_DN778261_c0_g1_i1.p1 TRINITY_DN778261_c0_g1~~TRINITY_DN778261_c0_g1_i1.p1  ORF type:complete len:260 (-),score=74.08 TRINITY_DN778261_c0_g1_i1:168-947(-)